MKKCSYCGRISDDARRACDGCGTALPKEGFEEKSPQLLAAEARIRRAALLQAVFWAVFSAGILAAGLLYPAWYLGPVAVKDFDNRLEKAWLFSLIASFTFALLAVRSLLRACNPESKPPSQ